MDYSILRYTGNGSVKAFAVPFEFLNAAHVEVWVDSTKKVIGTDYDLSNGSVVFYTAPTGVVTLKRVTPRDARMVDFQDASVLTEEALDTSFNQLFYILQEAYDAASTSVAQDYDGNYTAQGKRIKNLAAPVDPQDAVPLSSLTSFVTQAQAAVTAAEAEADAAAVSAAAAASAAAGVSAGLGISKAVVMQYIKSGSATTLGTLKFIENPTNHVLNASPTVDEDLVFLPQNAVFSFNGPNLIVSY